MSNRVASTSPCTSSGCGCTRYQIDKPVTKAITTPTAIDGSQVGEGGGCFLTSPGGAGAPCVWTSGFGISIAYSARLNAACRNQISSAPHNCEGMGEPFDHFAGARKQVRRDQMPIARLRAAQVQDAAERRPNNQPTGPISIASHGLRARRSALQTLKFHRTPACSARVQCPHEVYEMASSLLQTSRI